ncbi:conserved hypothetical protein [Ketogulonicigenium vulgare Y25]|uniref:Transporter n=1 Tax=Ketogulonicigenium vulgare (strain WSH-001) TaxID=759362 RepID=F9Y429_KETVW|nr:conserved hypothetical protein [Ketogulonicigenium vulgare Y25]AEM40465.1 hypothetical protein KVU_0626 [Ketogulonicigenium vulgare WSH-001]ALJ80650.1 hypothetical protein KVH_05335 [Ketogulonicigenium vulgare]ANW33465.1 hypothetical protein KvSKV_05305 [Ketogulonicigenium vulgare]AOZ54181.1 hypothetical protein KVC_1164 [Ketogulonicigenium vulgare]
MRIIPLAFLIATYGAAAQGGAWPRAEGETFTTVGANVALFSAVRPVHYDPTYYVEFGATGWLTVGADGFQADRGTARSDYLFARVPVLQDAAGHQLAVSLAYGQIYTDMYTAPMGRIALHWGYGLQQGWLSADAIYEGRLGSGDDLPDLVQSKVEVTWGHTFTDTPWMSSLSMQMGEGISGDFYAKVMSAGGYAVTEAITLRASVTQALTGDRGAALGLDAWLTF